MVRYAGRASLLSPSEVLQVFKARSSLYKFAMERLMQSPEETREETSLLLSYLIYSYLSAVFDKDLLLGGVIFNRIGGDSHKHWLKEAVESSGLSVSVLGGIPKVCLSIVKPWPEHHCTLKPACLKSSRYSKILF